MGHPNVYTYIHDPSPFSIDLLESSFAPSALSLRLNNFLPFLCHRISSWALLDACIIEQIGGLGAKSTHKGCLKTLFAWTPAAFLDRGLMRRCCLLAAAQSMKWIHSKQSSPVRICTTMNPIQSSPAVTQKAESNLVQFMGVDLTLNYYLKQSWFMPIWFVLMIEKALLLKR